MKNKILLPILSAGSFFLSLPAQSQEQAHSQPGEFAYAVTDSVRDGIKWNFLRTLDLRTGIYSDILVQLLNNNELTPPANTPPVISCNGVAAIAHDKRNKRVYYTPMLTDKLYYIDLRTMNRHLVTNNFTGLMPKANDQGNIITRMAIGDDDKGYALTNDGRHLIRFRTTSNPAITDLGSLVDAPGNNEMSVHNTCSSFGGDIVADDDDNLYLFTAGKHVYKIDIRTRVAKYIGTVAGLPASFTASGAAVDKSREKVVLVSSADASDVYSISIKTLSAGRLYANHPWLASDLGSHYILKNKRYSNDDRMIVSYDNAGNDHIQVYPNPVPTKEFKINFTDANAGTYMVRVTDAEGKSILTRTVTIGGKGNTVSVSLPEQVVSGIYIVRITDKNNKAWYSGKIFVQ